MSNLPPYERDVNTVFQDYALFPHMTVGDNVAYGLMIRKVPKAERARRSGEMLELVRLSGTATRKPSQLTAVLANSGALAHGSVATFDVDTGRGNWSTSATLRLRYSDGAQGDRPPRLFLKMVNADLDDEFFGPSEVTYYTRDYLGVQNAPLLRCYDAHFSESCRNWQVTTGALPAMLTKWRRRSLKRQSCSTPSSMVC